MVQFHGWRAVVMGIDGYQYADDGSKYSGRAEDLTPMPALHRSIVLSGRDWYIDGEWKMRSPCPWLNNQTLLNRGYRSLEAASNVVGSVLAEYPELELMIVMRVW